MYVADVVEGLRARPARVLSAALGLALGWMCVALSLSIACEVRAAVRRLEREFGLTSAALLLGGSLTADRASLDEFRAAAPDAEWAGFAVLPMDPLAVAGTSPTLVLADEHLGEAGVYVLREGRMWDAADVAARAPVALLTEAAAVALNWRPPHPRRLRDGRLWTAVGIVAAETGPGAAVLPPAAVLVPWSSWAVPAEARRLDRVVVRAPNERSLARAIERTTRLFGEPGRADRPHQWLTAEVVRGRIGRSQRTAIAGTAALGALALLLGGLALSSRLSGEVRHRTPEIGLRRALGAMPAQIAGLFVGEAVVVELAAAGVGLLFALVLSAAARALGARLPPPTPAVAALVTGVSVPMAVVLAALPARRAARIAPSEALRDE